MRRFLLTLDTIDILCLVYSYYLHEKILFKVHERAFTDIEFNYFSWRNLIQLSTKNQSYPELPKFDTLELKNTSQFTCKSIVTHWWVISQQICQDLFHLGLFFEQVRQTWHGEVRNSRNIVFTRHW